MNMTIQIGEYSVGVECPPFVIAEMSGNHNQSLERAFDLVDAAARAGAHAIKLQTYTANTITLNVRHGEFNITNEHSPWKGRNLYDLYTQAYTPWEWHAPIMRRAASHGLICFSSPFDESAVDFLDSLGVPAFKIASFENNHLPLIKKAAQTRKPLIISTGMATLGELDEAVKTARQAGCQDLILLKCTSTYPASPKNTNIQTIPHMRELFGCQVGLSDHTLGVGVSVAAVALGATVIEKHLTLRRSDGGIDSAFSLEPEELKSLVDETRNAWQGIGQITYGPTVAEIPSLEHRRSLYIAQDMKAGEVFTTKNLRVVRPGNGLAPRYYQNILGKRIRMDALMGTPLSWRMVD